MCFGVDFENLTQQIYFFDPNHKNQGVFLQNSVRTAPLRVVRSRQHHDGTYIAILSSEKKENHNFSFFEHGWLVSEC